MLTLLNSVDNSSLFRTSICQSFGALWKRKIHARTGPTISYLLLLFQQARRHQLFSYLSVSFSQPRSESPLKFLRKLIAPNLIGLLLELTVGFKSQRKSAK